MLEEKKFDEKELTEFDNLKSSKEYEILMMRYDSAIREVATKLEILNSELSLVRDESPISSIQSRRKKDSSIFEKLVRQGNEISLKSIEENLNDVAGIRVICSFVDDIYRVARMLARQDDIKVVMIKDYIKKPKSNGYRSYHMIVEIPVFFSNEKRPMRVEVQIRTVAMNFWASLEHQIKYKHNVKEAEKIGRDLKDCADTIANTDLRMQKIREVLKDDLEHVE